MDVFRRSAAVRVIYRSALTLPPRSYSSVSFSLFGLLSLSFSLFLLHTHPLPSLHPPFALSCLFCLYRSNSSSRSLSALYFAPIRQTGVADRRESEGSLMNATTKSLFSSVYRSRFSLPIFLLRLVPVANGVSLVPRINARFIPWTPWTISHLHFCRIAINHLRTHRPTGVHSTNPYRPLSRLAF